ncbi:MAG TPA: phosphatidate cytidylyltransferase [Thermohalobaculum sp.]|nr:phosphatidate cytidylyltransferase [Thermohalobaculum sp.]
MASGKATGPGSQPSGSTPSGSGPRFADLRLRVVSAAVAAGVGVAAVWAGGIWMALLVAAVCGAMIWEYRSVTLHRGGPCGADVAYLLAGVAGAALLAEYYSWIGAVVWLAWSLIAAAVADLAGGRRRALGWGIAGGAYIGAAAIGIVVLRGLEPHGLLTVLWLVLVVAAADIGGYFGGRLVGGPKLWPRVSPKKTWAGFVGGLLLAALAGALFSAATAGTVAAQVALISTATALVAQAGDLAESALKRRFGVKDSGRLLPGHGGALDRFDGLAPAAAAVALASGLSGGSPVIG